MQHVLFFRPNYIWQCPGFLCWRMTWGIREALKPRSPSLTGSLMTQVGPIKSWLRLLKKMLKREEHVVFNVISHIPENRCSKQHSDAELFRVFFFTAEADELLAHITNHLWRWQNKRHPQLGSCLCSQQSGELKASRLSPSYLHT